MDRRFQIKPREVVHETIQGEVIIIQLARGNYFSLGGSGEVVWRLLGAGLGRNGLTTAIAAAYDADPAEVEGAIESLLATMVEEGLIEVTDEAAVESAPFAIESGDGFAAPSLDKYSDMQDFLLIDPVHEVSDVGWPSPAS